MGKPLEINVFSWQKKHLINKDDVLMPLCFIQFWRMAKLNISNNHLTIVLYQDFFVFSFSESKKCGWDFERVVNCAETVPKANGPIECCAFSPCGKNFAICFDKNIIIYSTADWNPLYVRPGERKASSVQFFPTSKIIFIADKSGCATFYSFKDGSLQKTDITLGHNSMLTSALITDDEKFVITSDRDEKIRVTNYPNVYNIENYCLGHEMFVTCIGFLPNDKRILLSSSGDGTIRFWDFILGKELAVFDCNDENTKATIIKFVSCEINQLSILGIQQYKSNQIKIITVKGGLSTCLQIEIVEILKLKSIPWDIAFHDKILVCLLPDQNNPIVTWSSEGKDSNSSYANISLYLADNWDSFTNNCSKISDDIPVLFKREVDNLQEYEQRKKARLLKTGKTS